MVLYFVKENYRNGLVKRNRGLGSGGALRKEIVQDSTFNVFGYFKIKSTLKLETFSKLIFFFNFCLDTKVEQKVKAA